MKKNISIVGSTGSIGIQAIDVVRKWSDRFKIVGLAACSNWEELLLQTREFNPSEISIFDAENYERLKNSLADRPVKIWCQGMEKIAVIEEADIVLVSVVGISGMMPTIAAIEKKKNVALATKEVLVAGGNIVMDMARNMNVSIIPVDSEHSAVFQCINGENKESVSRIILTSSGGPFRGYDKNQMKGITKEMALSHPTWKMGAKITIDSATLMNKGFEVLEAHYLFSVPLDRIEVVVHKESIVHSLVEFHDGSVIAQLSPPDMRLPIQYALSWPDRIPYKWKTLNLVETETLSFEKPDFEMFPCLALAYEAGKIGGTLPAVLNAANEIAVNLFLSGDLQFTRIHEVIEKTMRNHNVVEKPSLTDIIEADKWARVFSKELIISKI